MSNERGWSTLVAKCKSLYERYGGGIETPSHYVPDPVEVFDETDVSPNVFRFMIYILWFATQPYAFAKYLLVRDCRRDLWEESIYKLWNL